MKIQYKIIGFHSSALDAIEDRLNDLGAVGWDIAWLEDNKFIILKRPAPINNAELNLRGDNG